MAIAFARLTIHTRSKGHSAVAAAAYRTGQALYDEKTGINYDFKNRGGVSHAEILLPHGSHERFEDRETLWNEVERAEKRKNSQLCKDVVLALPQGFPLETQIELTKRFAHFHYVQHGVPTDFAIHDLDTDNPHAHVLVTTRRLIGDKFSQYKARDLNPGFAKGGFIKEKDFIGEAWREFQNEFFKEKKIDISVDLNHILTEQHEGRIDRGEPHEIKENNNLIREARREIALNDIDNFVNLLSLKASVFTKRDVDKLLFKTLLYDENDHMNAVSKVFAHKGIVSLGRNDDGRICYTTRQHYVAESRLFDEIDALKKANTIIPENTSIEHYASKYSLSSEQELALKHLQKSHGVSSLIGKPGTGKTYLMKAMREALNDSGFEVFGTSISSKAVKGLEAESGIQSSTFASLNYRLSKGYLKLNDKSVVLVDEAGMADFASIASLVGHVKSAKAKLVLVGDPEQLKPIGKGEIFRGIADSIGFFSMEDIRRQQDKGDRRATLALSSGDTEFALSHYDAKGALHISPTLTDSINDAVISWSEDIRETGSFKDSVLLAFQCKTVHALNFNARHEMNVANLVEERSYRFVIRKGRDIQLNDREAELEKKLGLRKDAQKTLAEIELSLGERVLFKQKDAGIGVDNGDLGTITSINENEFSAVLDNGRSVTIHNKVYQHFDYGYAMTVHKAQGVSVNRVHTVIDSNYWNRQLSYVAMSRHKDKLQIYADKDAHPTLDTLKTTISRKQTKDNAIDWPINYALRLGYNPDSIIGKAVNHIVGLGKKIKDKWLFIRNYEDSIEAISKDRPIDDADISRAKSGAISKDKARESAFSSNLVREIKNDNTLVRDFCDLYEERKNKSGYGKEKIEKEMIKVSANIKKDKALTEKIKAKLPILSKDIVRSNSIDRGKTIDD